MRSNPEYPSTDDDRSEQLIELFDQARALTTEGRKVFLIRVCGNDEELRRELESLLEHSDPALPTSASKLAARQLADDERQDWTGQQINQYHLLGVLGEGGMGKVYLAEDEKLARQVAIKFLPTTFADDANQLLRFEQEARAASALNHPNIITIYEIGRHESAPYIAYELIEGKTLRQRLCDSPLDWQEAVAIGTQIASALKAAHNARIIHRDIKPENVMLRADGLVKVLDFGIAKRFDLPATEAKTGVAPIEESSATQAGQILGTIGYLSPEQARGEQIDDGTDIFSLGVLMFELLAGQRPFARTTPQEQIAALLNNEEAPDVRALCPQIPAALAAIVAKALRKERQERYDKAGEMLVVLEELKNDLSINETGEQIVTQSANRLLTQFTILSLSRPQTRIPLGKLWTIWYRSNLKRGGLENGLMRRSLRKGLLRVGAWALAIALITVGFAAAMSVTNQFGDEQVLRDGHTAGVRRAAFSPNGRWLVSVSEDHSVRVWDFARRELKRELKDHHGWVVAVSFSPDGKYFATASWDKSVIVWDAERLEKVAVLRDERGAFTGVAFSPDGKYLAAATHTANVTTVWCVGSWQKYREIPLGAGDWAPLLFSPNQPQLLYNPGQTFNIETGRQIPRSKDYEFAAGLEFSPDGSRAVSVRSEGEVIFFDALREKIIGSPHFVHRDNGRAVAFSPDGKLVATGAEDIILWNVETQEMITHWDHSSNVWGLRWSPNGEYLISTHGDGSILLWDIAARERVANLNQHSLSVNTVAFSPNGQQVASGSNDCSVIIWNAVSGHKEAVLLGHPSRINTLAFSPDGQWLVSIDQTGEMIRWDIEQRRPSWRGSIGPIGQSTLAISSDGRWIANDKGVFASDSGRAVYKFDSEPIVGPPLIGAAFSRDNHRLVAVSSRWIYLFDTRDWHLIDHQQFSNGFAVSFSLAEGQLAIGSLEGNVELWQTEPLSRMALLGCHKARVKQISFSSDGRFAVSVGDDKTVRLWDVNARRQVQEIGTHTTGVLSVAFSRDGQQIVTGEHDNSVRIYTRKSTLWGRPLD